MAERIGTVTELWRYPVKSMGGERLDPATAGERGLAGDRAWAIVDAETGKVASAKRPKLWGPLLEFTASYATDPSAAGSPAPLRISLPDGREVSSDDPDHDRILSEAIGRPVTLTHSAPEGASYELNSQDAEGLQVDDPERLTESQVALFAPGGTFFDTCTLHVLPSSSLETLARAHPDGRWERPRFRPNVMVELDDPPEDGFAENAWAAHTLELGADVEVAVLAPMPRCVMTTVAQRELPHDPLILRTLAERNRVDMPGRGSYACVGVLANVSAGGTLAVGDEIRLGAPL